MYIVAWLKRGEFGLCSAVHAVKHRKNVHGARLGDRLAKQPQQLLIPERCRRALSHEPRHVVQPELEPARPAGPRKGLIAHHEQHDPALPTSGASALSPSPTASSAPECTARRRCRSGGDAAREGAREVRQPVSTSTSSPSSVSTSTSISVVPAPTPASMRERHREGVGAAAAVVVMDVTPDPDADTGDALVGRTSRIWRTRTRRRRSRSPPVCPTSGAALYAW